jgi:starch phosphorylase
VEEVAELRRNYDPAAIIAGDEDFRRVVDLLECGHFNRHEPGVLDDVIASFQDPSDPWVTAADFRSYIETQRRVDDAFRDQEHWTTLSILNSAASGRFSTDRTMRDYNEDIWRLEPVSLD